MPKTANRRRKRGADEEDAADGSANKRSATSVLTSLDVNDAPRLELPLFQLNGRHSDRHGQGDEEEGEEEEEVTGGGGGGSSAPAAAASGQSPHQQRRLWVKDRSRAWWEQCSSADYPEADFRAAFRMGRATFAMLCDALGAAVAKEDTALRAAIPVRQRVAVCVWRLATGEPLRLVSKRFGLGISTCHKLVLEVCAAIRNLLMPRFLRWPDAAAVDGFKARFQADSGIPGVVGAIYTTHIPIIAPKVSVAAYFNRRHTERNHKTSYSITLQGVVGPDGAFTDVCIGWPGSMPDDQVLDRSALQQRAAAGMMAGSWVVGGASYPLTDWVLAPYAQPNLTWAQHAFNEKVAELRRVAVDAFARLKGRWACLQKRTEVKLQDLPVVLGACCVLHNICESRGEEMDPALRCELADDETVPENPVRSDSSRKARDDIAHNLLHSGLAGTKFF
ncbi:protein ANTAGONIST OF LIKE HETEROCHROMATIN PROTEIN 1-like [Panicum hallii]|uniref:protein ANTAGONIST OF LIKE HETEROCHROMATIN PROTEIN 1-like n=1 Tax=Panicum hallii TaxID=206008 RepID=UPI000DF4E859|nr:protein ANTAGONIST OF LIKE HETEROCHROMATIN PROTEIN 1-like [Panicum hallii]